MLETLPVLSAKVVYNPYAKHPKFFRLVFIFSSALKSCYIYIILVYTIKKFARRSCYVHVVVLIFCQFLVTMGMCLYRKTGFAVKVSHSQSCSDK